ncbi:hypothetical protein GOQ27_06795 [Clostridium sp. D2Q-11]|uniref:Uncharacterized protein n=1 Tax=Anaeromonas frigoriresistens TaxID=2683708 RepID=A0A942Z8D1_9FIRM|nr:hypothetical protein [Anaeromonas frigoriresistens]MBS4538163.1 hypothetical protein [Anaeromonas frigoriresistens]
MVIFILYVFIYVFFIYGIIEFTKHLYTEYDIPKRTHQINIVMRDEKDFEYTLISIKDKFSHICIYADMKNKELIEMIRVSSSDFNIEIHDINELK